MNKVVQQLKSWSSRTYCDAVGLSDVSTTVINAEFTVGYVFLSCAASAVGSVYALYAIAGGVAQW